MKMAKKVTVVKKAHNFWGTTSGAGVGALAGTFIFPGVGTIVGGVIGGGLGYILRDAPESQGTVVVEEDADEAAE
jgi:hypothetical protein